MKHVAITAATARPNMMMLEFMLFVHKNGGGLLIHREMEPEEATIAWRVGVENGWLTEKCQLTAKGKEIICPIHPDKPLSLPKREPSNVIHEFKSIYAERNGLSKPLFERLRESMPPLMFAALCELHACDGGYEAFERKYKIPARSAKVITPIALENFQILMTRFL